MGMFDYVYVSDEVARTFCKCVRCEREIKQFQTKDLSQELEEYLLSFANQETDHMELKKFGDSSKQVGTEGIHQRLNFYNPCESCNTWNEFEVEFTNGTATKVRRLS